MTEQLSPIEQSWRKVLLSDGAGTHLLPPLERVEDHLDGGLALGPGMVEDMTPELGQVFVVSIESLQVSLLHLPPLSLAQSPGQLLSDLLDLLSSGRGPLHSHLSSQ